MIGRVRRDAESRIHVFFGRRRSLDRRLAHTENGLAGPWTVRTGQQFGQGQSPGREIRTLRMGWPGCGQFGQDNIEQQQLGLGNSLFFKNVFVLAKIWCPVPVGADIDILLA